jgi:hypothetical protein
VSSGRRLVLLVLLAALLAGCGSGASKTVTAGNSNSVVLQDVSTAKSKSGEGGWKGYAPLSGSGQPVPELFFQGCARSDACVARAERIRRFPPSAVPEGDPGLRGRRGRCRSFADPFDSYWIRVAHRHTTCGVALLLMHAIFWHKTKTHSHVVGSFTADRFPRWHCHEATGAGQCTDGSQIVYFGIQNMYLRSG